MNFPKVSVIVPVHNKKSFLRKAVLSLLKDSSQELEIIVIDDGSTDGSIATVSDLPLRLFVLPNRKGVSYARNMGLRHASGDHIAFLDSDDLLSPGGLAWRARWLTDHPNERAVLGLVEMVIDEKDVPVKIFFPLAEKLQASLPPRIDLSFFRAGGKFAIPNSCCLYRRSFLEMVGAFDETLPLAQDQDFFYRALTLENICVIPKPVFQYRIHTNNASIVQNQGDYFYRKKALAYATLVRIQYGIMNKTSPNCGRNIDGFVPISSTTLPYNQDGALSLP